MSKNNDLARLFNRAADVLALLDENQFRILALRKVARVVEDMAEPIENVAAENRLESIPGIGKHSAEKIQEYLRTGHIAEFEQLAAQVPSGVLDMLNISSVGVKTAYLLWKEAGITDIPSLKKALQAGTITGIKGFGEKKQANIKQNLAFMETAGARIGLGYAAPLAHELLHLVQSLPGVAQATYCGSLRRGKETVGDLDILISSDPDAAPDAIARQLAEAVKRHPEVEHLTAEGDTKVSLRTRLGLQVDFRIVPPASWGAALQYFTGSKEHNVRLRQRASERGMKLNEWGLFRGETRIAGENEEDIYHALQLAFICPEMREDRGEIELAEALFQAAAGQAVHPADPRLEFIGKTIPEVWRSVDLTDIRGDMHMHTTASDGHESIEAMITAAKKRGYQYIAITDHSKSQVQAGGLSVDRLMKHIEAVRAAAAKVCGIEVLAGSEVDILADGSLDYPDDVLAKLDWVVASPHSALTQEGEAATARLIRAVSHPLVDVIGHPTGRLIGGRRGMETDMQKVVMAAARSGGALEINSHDMRLDLRDVHARLAVEAGVPLCINTDAHQISDFDKLPFGMATARRAWARAENILNTWPLEKIRAWQKKRRRGDAGW
ncbi:MAG: PHP domain-containing protein [Phycisphaerae bacterium]